MLKLKLMKRLFLVILLLLIAIPSKAATPRLVVFYDNNSNGPAVQDEVECTTEILKRQGWAVDYYNASLRTWGSGGQADMDWFATTKGYKACLVMNWDGATAAVTTGGPYGLNFQNAAGVARVSESPLGGRWPIPCVVLAERISPSVSLDDTTANNFVCGLVFSTFGKQAEDTAGTWRYKMVGRLGPNDSKDTLYADPRFFTCRPQWAGAGTVAALLWADTTNGFNRCGTDTVMNTWRYQPRGDRPGVVYTLLQSQYSADVCTSTLFALQYIAVNSQCKPMVVTKVPLFEHNSYPTTITVQRIANYKALKDAQTQFGIKYIAALPQVAPVALDISRYNDEILAKLREHFNNGTARWQPQSNSSGWTMNFFNSTDTTEVRKAFNATMNCAVSDTFKFPKNAMYIKSLVTAAGEVGVNQGKVLKDAGVDIIETTFNNVDPNGWAFQFPNRSNQLTPYIIPGDGRVIYTRFTTGLGENATFTGLINGAGGAEYIGRTFVTAFSRAMISNVSLYYHCNIVCGDDPYAQWLYTRVLTSYFRFFNRLMVLDYTANQIAPPIPQ